MFKLFLFLFFSAWQKLIALVVVGTALLGLALARPQSNGYLPPASVSVTQPQPAQQPISYQNYQQQRSIAQVESIRPSVSLGSFTIQSGVQSGSQPSAAPLPTASSYESSQSIVATDATLRSTSVVPATSSQLFVPASTPAAQESTAVIEQSVNSPVAQQTYSAPAPVAQQTYSAAAPVVQQSYLPPGPVAQQIYSAPAQQLYSAPAPAAAPVIQQSYAPAPTPVVQQTYSAPAPVVQEQVAAAAPVLQQTYSAPVSVVQESQSIQTAGQVFSAPAPVIQESRVIASPSPAVQEIYSTPAAAPVEQQTYSGPVGQTISSPAAVVQQSYVAPTQAIQESYVPSAAPVVQQTFAASAPVVQQTYAAPAPVVQQSYAIPAPAVQQAYSAPATVIQQVQEPVIQQAQYTGYGYQAPVATPIQFQAQQQQQLTYAPATLAQAQAPLQLQQSFVPAPPAPLQLSSPVAAQAAQFTPNYSFTPGLAQQVSYPQPAPTTLVQGTATVQQAGPAAAPALVAAPTGSALISSAVTATASAIPEPVTNYGSNGGYVYGKTH